MNSLSAESPSLESLIAEVADQFIDRLERGEQPDIQAIAAAHPECATVIRQVLSSLDLMRFATPAVQDGTSAGDVAVTGVLGDFRIVREVGRGGMGIVYEATQISLGRRVALKVLPFAAALDSRQLQRFKNEAQAAAHLHHQNIVPVYSVGCERGVHYYAMQFIEGRTVASMIQAVGGQNSGPGGIGAAETAQARGASTERSCRTPAYFRSVARLAHQAAAALEHAHQIGIIHRDIKPANLLVDERGNLWITDFGLARLTNEAGLTMTGDVIGTLRYMSPEQALGQGTPLDHRTDIYSLGITLYELVTLGPALPGTDRAGLARRITDEEPRRPRQINRAVPPELETIILKTTAKAPADRYRSAQELADDLGRYLLDQPIRARRPSLWQRTRRWSRRHRSLLWSLLASLALALTSAVIILAISNARLARERLLTAEALARAEANYRSAENQRGRAESNFARALAAVDAMVSRAQARSSGPAGQDESLRRAMLADALNFCRQIVDEQPSAKAGPYEVGWAHYRMGSIYALLGQDTQAAAAWGEAMSRLEQVVAASPQVTEYRSSLASCCTAIGEWLRQTSADHDQAEKYLSRARSLQEALIAQDPDHVQYWRDLAGTEHGLGYLYSATGRIKECRQAYERALELLANVAANQTGDPGIAIERAKCSNSLGVALRMSGRAAEAETCHRQALAWVRSASVDPNAPLLDPEAWRAQLHLALSLAQQRHTAQALTELRQALAAKEGRATGTQDRVWRQDIALTMASLAALLESEGQKSEAEEWYRRGVSELEALNRQFPESAECSRSLALVASQLAALLWDLEHRMQADHLFGQAIASYDRSLSITPANAQTQNNLAWLLATCPVPGRRIPDRAMALALAAVQSAPRRGVYWNTLGVAQYRAGDNAQAIVSLKKSISLRSGGDPYDWLFLALSYRRAGDMREAVHWYSRVARALRGRSGKNAELGRLRAEADRAFQL
jgi:eukaryotic-like serine/threonine-protein kinase